MVSNRSDAYSTELEIKRTSITRLKHDRLIARTARLLTLEIKRTSITRLKPASVIRSILTVRLEIKRTSITRLKRYSCIP